MTLTAPTIPDLDILTALDVQLDGAIPCERQHHANPQHDHGCTDPEQPGHWRVLIGHDPEHSSCELHPMIVCDGFAKFMQNVVDEMTVFIAKRPTHFARCQICHEATRSVLGWFQVIGEVQ